MSLILYYNLPQNEFLSVAYIFLKIATCELSSFEWKPISHKFETGGVCFNRMRELIRLFKNSFKT